MQVCEKENALPFKLSLLASRKCQKATSYFSKIIRSGLAKSMAGTFIIKSLTLISSIMIIPIYIAYFKNNEILGVWFSIASVLNWILVFDLGLGNGLRNKITLAMATKNYTLLKEYISTAYAINGAIAFVIAFIGSISIIFLDWNSILNISLESIDENSLKISIAVMFIAIVVQFYIKIINSILLAMQKTVASSAIALSTQILLLASLFALNRFDTNNQLKIVTIINFISINVPLLVATLIVFSSELRKARPSFRFIKKEKFKEITVVSLQYFAIQLSLLVINTSNVLIITILYSPGAVVDYQLYSKIFSLLPAVFTMITTPVWSFVAMAHTSNDIEKIRSVYFFLNIIALVMSVIGFILILIMQSVFDIWLGDSAIKVSNLYLFVFAAQNATQLFSYSLTCVANGIGELKTQVICNSIASIVKVPLSIAVSSVYHSWIAIVVVSSVIIVPLIVIQPITIKLALRRREDT